MESTGTSSPSRSFSYLQQRAIRELKRRGIEPPKPKIDLTQYRNDPVAFAREVLGVEPWERQQDIMCSVALNRRTTVRSCHNSGKCLGIDERLPLADGRVVRAGDLVGHYFALAAFEKDGTQRAALAWATDNGIEPVYRITTETGRSIVRTGNHPLLAGRLTRGRGITPHRSDRLTPASQGFVPLLDLAPGDLVAVPSQLLVTGTRQREEREVKLLGLLLGDGGLTVGVTFTQQEGTVKEEFRQIIASYGVFCREIDALSLQVTAGARGGKSSPVLSLVRAWGLHGKKSNQKRFPDWVWELPNDQLALLLNRLFACDGWACTRLTSTSRVAEIGIASASEPLIRDVEGALLRLGISGRVRARLQTDGTDSGKRFCSWTWTAYSFREVQRFAAVVGILGKEEAVERARSCAAAYSPKKIRRWQFLNLPEGYHWEKVKAIEALGEQQTVAISVPETHTFVTSFVEHNTFAAACLTQWFLHCHNPSLVITTATTDRQVKLQLWGEIRQQHLKASLPGALRMQQLVVSPTQQALGFTTSEAEKFQGWHSSSILIIVDEASGVEEPIYAAIEGCLTGPNPRLLLIGNPNNAVGSFFESFRSDLYTDGRFHLQASDVPEFLLPASWAEERRQEWGEDSPLYQVRVLGQFPEQGEDSLISLRWAEEAQEAEIEPLGDVEGGVDVARFGADESVACLRRGGVVLSLEAWHGFDTSASAGRVAGMVRDQSVACVKVDDPGIGGGVTDKLRDLAREGLLAARVEAVNVGQAAHDKEKFYDRRSELYWGLRERFKTGDIGIPKDDVLLSQLTALRYSYTPRGQIRVEGKDELKKRRPAGAKWQSPDRADALMLAFATSGPRWIPIAMAGEGVAVGMPGWGGAGERSQEEQVQAARQSKTATMREGW